MASITSQRVGLFFIFAVWLLAYELMWGFFLSGCHEVIQAGHRTEAGDVGAPSPILAPIAWPPQCIWSPLFPLLSVNHSGRSSGCPLCHRGVSSHQGLISFSPHSIAVLQVRQWFMWYHLPLQIVSSGQGLCYQGVLKIWNSCKHNRKLPPLFHCILNTKRIMWKTQIIFL